MPPRRRPEPVRHVDPQTYRLQDSVGYLMKLTVAALRRELDRRMVEHELTGVQMLPLLLIDCGECHTAAELARLNGTDAGATTRLLDRLQAKGLLERVRSATDRRQVRLQLTPAGQALAARIPQAISESLNRALQDFSAAEVATLRRMLQRIMANVDGPA